MWYIVIIWGSVLIMYGCHRLNVASERIKLILGEARYLASQEDDDSHEITEEA